MDRAIDALRGKRSASQPGGKPPISALNNAFSIGPDRGQKTDGFGRRSVTTSTPRVRGGTRDAIRLKRVLGLRPTQASDARRACRSPPCLANRLTLETHVLQRGNRNGPPSLFAVGHDEDVRPLLRCAFGQDTNIRPIKRPNDDRQRNRHLFCSLCDPRLQWRRSLTP